VCASSKTTLQQQQQGLHLFTLPLTPGPQSLAFASCDHNKPSTMSAFDASRKSLLQVYRQLLRSAETYPSSNRKRIYQAIREEWRENATMKAEDAHVKVALAYKGLSQLRQFDEHTMTGGAGGNTWNVHLEQNPMPKPADYDERKKKRR
jgi:RNA-splicing ligase RtcB